MNDWNNILSSHIYQDGTRDFIQYNRFGSFAPPRSDTQICMFIDGACYMEAVAKAIAQAQNEIFITDWCMHPAVFLRRPVYRSPRSTRLWSHHEKMVAIDQSVVFLGGIDLCFGRWDTNDHRYVKKRIVYPLLGNSKGKVHDMHSSL
ncbi:unnamed protein product [Trichobilharzia regenti]|nr:unnamed protein product [Trichobilharzia regenti]